MKTESRKWCFLVPNLYPSVLVYWFMNINIISGVSVACAFLLHACVSVCILIWFYASVVLDLNAYSDFWIRLIGCTLGKDCLRIYSDTVFGLISCDVYVYWGLHCRLMFAFGISLGWLTWKLKWLKNTEIGASKIWILGSKGRGREESLASRFYLFYFCWEKNGVDG